MTAPPGITPEELEAMAERMKRASYEAGAVLCQDMPRLIAEVRRLRKENEGLDAAAQSLEDTVRALNEEDR